MKPPLCRSPDVRYDVFEAQRLQGRFEGLPRGDVPAEQTIVVIQHGVPMWLDADALRGPVDGRGPVSLGRPVQLAGYARLDVEGSHEVDGA